MDLVCGVNDVDVALEEDGEEVAGVGGSEFDGAAIGVAVGGPKVLVVETEGLELGPGFGGGGVQAGGVEEVFAVGEGHGVDIVGDAEDDAVVGDGIDFRPGGETGVED